MVSPFYSHGDEIRKIRPLSLEPVLWLKSFYNTAIKIQHFIYSY